jgi:hypothetical protein
VAINYDSGESDKISICINGRLILEEGVTHAFVPQADALFFSNWRWLEKKYNGAIKEIIIKNSLLTDDELKNNMDNFSYWSKGNL